MMINCSEEEREINQTLDTSELVLKALKYLSAYDECAEAIISLKNNTSRKQKHNSSIDKLENKKEELYKLYWNVVSTVQARGTDPELKYCKDLITSYSPNRRVLGADILGQLCYQNHDKYHEFAVRKLIELLEDKNEDVIASSGIGLSHRLRHKRDVRAIPKLVALAGHSSPKVRYSIVCALGAFECPSTINALIKLSYDKDFDIRNWAVFNLGSQIETDSTEIRATLKHHLNDEDYEIRGEAFIGLAERDDKSILDKLKQELEGDFKGSYVLKASELMAEPSLLPYLLTMRDTYQEEMTRYHLSCLKDAIKSCSMV